MPGNKRIGDIALHDASERVRVRAVDQDLESKHSKKASRQDPVFHES